MLLARLSLPPAWPESPIVRDDSVRGRRRQLSAPEELTSPRSARVTSVRALHDRRHRVQRGAFVVEGPQAVEAAVVASGVRELYLTEAADLAHPDLAPRVQDGGGRVVRMTEAVARAMSETDNPQGVIAVCGLVTKSWSPDGWSPVNGSPARLRSSGSRVLVVLDRISDPGNAGTIIRTADAAGAAAVVFTRGSVDPHNGKCVRATAGSIFHLPIITDVDAKTVIDDARRAGWLCLAADGHGEVVLGTPAAHDVSTGDVLWVFGSEAHGVAPEVAAAVDARVAIPILGAAESLNLATSVAICLFAPILQASRT